MEPVSIFPPDVSVCCHLSNISIDLRMDQMGLLLLQL